MTCKEIKDFLNEFSGFKIESKNRKIKYIYFRSIYYYLCLKYSEDGFSYESIAEIIDRKSHITAMNGINEFYNFIETDRVFQGIFQRIEPTFLKQNKIEDYVLDITSADILNLGKRCKRLKKANAKKDKQITCLKSRISSLKKRQKKCA